MFNIFITFEYINLVHFQNCKIILLRLHLHIIINMSQFDQEFSQNSHKKQDNKPLALQYRSQSYRCSIVQKFNVIQMGINFLVPHVWYQQLCEINFKVKMFTKLMLPSFTIEQILIAYGFMEYNQQSSRCFLNQGQQKLNILSDHYFPESQEYNGIKLDKINNINNNFLWKLINPHLWRIIQQKASTKDKIKSRSLPIFIEEDFLKANKFQLLRGQKKVDTCIILFRNKYYSSSETILNKYVFESLFIGQKKFMQLTMIQQKKKITIRGFFDSKLKLKNAIISFKKVFNFKDQAFQIFIGKNSKQSITRLTTLEMIQQNEAIIILYPSYDTLKSKVQFQKQSFDKFLKSSIIQKAYKEIFRDNFPYKDKCQYIPLNQIKSDFKSLEMLIQSNIKNNIIDQSEIFLNRNFKNKISSINIKRQPLNQVHSQQQAMINESDAQNQRNNIRSISTYECTTNLSFRSEQLNNANQYRNLVRQRFRSKKKKNNNLKKCLNQKHSDFKNRFEHKIFKEASNEELLYFKLVSKSAIFNQTQLIRLPDAHLEDQQKELQKQLLKLVQYFQKRLIANELSKDLEQQIDIQKRKMQRQSKQKMKEEQIITIIDNQWQMDLQRQSKKQEKFYFDKEEEYNQKQKTKIKNKKLCLLSSITSEKRERQEDRISIQTQTEQVQFYSNEHHMIDQDQQAI